MILYLESEFHKEVQRLVDIDVQEPVTEPTEWVNSHAIAENEALIDFSNLCSLADFIKKKLT